MPVRRVHQTGLRPFAVGSQRGVIQRAGTALELSGLLDHNQGMALVTEVERALHGSVGRVVLDLRRVTVVDSRGLLALIAVEVARLAAGRARAGEEGITLEPTGATVDALRKLVEEHFHKERQLGFYADRLAMTVDRLNDHVRRATGVTAGHLIRQRVLTEAKRQLVFTSQPIHEIAYDLAFSDPSHFARFFRKQTGTTPHEFRAARGG